MEDDLLVPPASEALAIVSGLVVTAILFHQEYICEDPSLRSPQRRLYPIRPQRLIRETFSVKNTSQAGTPRVPYRIRK